MNSSQYMDKQIMDLSNSHNNNDFVNLMNLNEDDNQDTKGGYMVPNYEFDPIRTIGSSPPKWGHVGGATRTNWDFAESKGNTSSFRNYGSLDSMEPAKVIVEKDTNTVDASLLSEIDHTMKKYANNLLYAIESVSARLSQLETRIRQIEISVDELKLSVDNKHTDAHGKLRLVEDILREVQDGVQVVKNKQDIMDTQLQLAKIQLPKLEQEVNPHGTTHADSAEYAASAPPPPLQYPVQPNPIPSGTPSETSIPPPPHQQYHLRATSIPPSPHKQYQTPATSIPPPPHQQYQMPATSIPPPPHQQHQMPATSIPPPPHQQHQMPATSIPPPPHQQYQPSPSALYSQPPPPSHPSPSQQFYAAPPDMFEPSSSRPSPGFSGRYGPSNSSSESSPFSSSPAQYVSGSQSGGSGYPQLPTARILPQALPTATTVGNGSSSHTGNRVPVDDVVDKVTNMGFSRDQVRATVRRLTENGQSVDLNVVLDKLMNDGQGQNYKPTYFDRVR